MIIDIGFQGFRPIMKRCGEKRHAWVRVLSHFSAEISHAGYREEKMHQQGYKAVGINDLRAAAANSAVNRGEAVS